MLRPKYESGLEKMEHPEAELYYFWLFSLEEPADPPANLLEGLGFINANSRPDDSQDSRDGGKPAREVGD